MSKKALSTAFNDNFIKLTKTLHQLIPDNQHLEAIKNAVHIGARVNSDLYIKHFYKEVAIPFESQILAKNEQFFLNLDLSSLSSVTKEQAEEASGLKNMWKTFTEEQQNILWQYMIVLTKLSQRWQNAS